jgi:hypothetical protein
MSFRPTHGTNIGSYATLLVAVLVGLAVPVNVATRSNREAVRAYLRAIYEYEGVVLSNVGAARNEYRTLALRIGSECPGVISGSRVRIVRPTQLRPAQEFRQTAYLREEVYAALRGALLAPDRRASLVLAAKLRMLRWNTPALQRRVNGYAKALEQSLERPVLNPCLDMKAWAASDYRTLSPATEAFVREYRPPGRLVIRNDSTTTMRYRVPSRLEREAKRYDRSLLAKVRVLKRRLASAFGGLVIIRRHLERMLGFPTLGK